MIRLVVMRHAKAQAAIEGMSDHARPLDARGRKDAPRVASDLVHAGWEPQLALVSDAARTEETWAWMAERFRAFTPFSLVPSLYHGTVHDLRAVVRARVTTETTVLALGHNPGWEDALEALTGRRRALKTAEAALLAHRRPWREAIERSDWQLVGLLGPDRPPL